MNLRIKEEYKEYSFGGGRLNKIRLTNLDPSLFEYYYENGYSEFFEEVVDKTEKKIIIEDKIENKDIENDTNK